MQVLSDLMAGQGPPPGGRLLAVPWRGRELPAIAFADSHGPGLTLALLPRVTFLSFRYEPGACTGGPSGDAVCPRQLCQSRWS